MKMELQNYVHRILLTSKITKHADFVTESLSREFGFVSFKITRATYQRGHIFAISHHTRDQIWNVPPSEVSKVGCCFR